MKRANPLQIVPVAQPWDGFLVGPENRLAHASILALARGESAGVSPLVVHGGAGVGKSRLLSGLVGETLARRPGASAARLEAEAAGRSGGWAAGEIGVGSFF
jgi:chromosomal replication initiator protein